MKNSIFLTIALIVSLASSAGTITAIRNGNWSNASTWDLNRTPTGSDIVVIPLFKTVTLNTNENSGDDLTLKIYGTLNIAGGKLRLGSAGAVWLYGIAATITSTGSNAETIKFDNVTIFDGNSGTNGTISGSQVARGTLAAAGFVPFAPLPVKFAGFSVTRSYNNNLVQWATASEMNSSMFEVQRSYDGATFTTIAYVAGAGTSNVTNNYSYTDKNITASVTYYRIKEVDLDGQLTYTTIKIVTAEAETSATVKFSGVNGKILMQFGSQKITGTVVMSVLSANGQVISQQTLSSTLGQVVISTPVKGHYIVALSNGKDFKAAGQIIL